MPPYNRGLATMWSPAAARLKIANVLADCPEDNRVAPTPPSRAAMRSSMTALVGLVNRV